MHRRHRTHHATGIPGWGSTPGWDQPLPGWSPLLDHGLPSLRVAVSVARWWWPTLAVAGFLAVVAYVTDHDHPGPSPSNRGLFTIALAAVVIVLLTIHRTAGPRPLARATAEYTVVALLAALLTLTGGVEQQPANSTGSTAKTETRQAATDKPNADAGQDHRPGVLRVAAGVARAVTTAIRAITGAASWVADLWRQADANTDHPNPSPTTTTPRSTGEAMASSPASPLSTRRLL
jgi:hypothetical protein